MASVSFEKLKTSNDVKRTIRHCDTEKRLEDNHSNKQIDKKLTLDNMVLKLDDYETVCNIYDEKMKFLDSQPNANKRSDKVTCFGLNVPLPKGLQNKDIDTKVKWFDEVAELVGKQYGSDNILNGYVHLDEVHKYTNAESGNIDTSREHFHLFVMPIIDNRLNGRDFSNRKNMNMLNNSIQKMSLDKFNVEFMDGSKKKSTKTVEQLKNDSRFLEVQNQLNEQQLQLNHKARLLTGKENSLNAKESNLNAIESDLNDKLSKVSEREYNVKQREINVNLRYKQLEEEKEDYKRELQLKAKADVTAYCNSIADECKRLARRNGQSSPNVNYLMKYSDDYDLEL